MENLKSLTKRKITHSYKNECFCGVSFEQIYFSKKIICFECYRTFHKNFLFLFESKNNDLDEIYLLEKDSFLRYYLNHIPIYSIKKIIQTDSESENESYSTLKNISTLPLPEIMEHSVRIRYTRNFSGFHVHLTKKEIIKISKYLFTEDSFLKKIIDKNFFIFSENNEMNSKFKHSYINILHREFYNSDNKKGILRVYIGEEDHFRMDVIFSLKNFDVNEMNTVIEALLKTYKFFLYLDHMIEWEFHQNFGFLTYHLTNVGSGIRLYTRIHTKEKTIDFLKYFQRNPIFFRLKNYTIRGKNGENSALESYITIGWDLPYLDIKKFYNQIKKKLIIWFYLFSYTIKNRCQ